jgi:FixJ family two-component response regulator
VDDDESLCRSVGRLLRAAGMQVVSYSSAESCLADAKRPDFDCLVLDIQLTGMTGIELHERLAAVGSRTPVIYITAHDDPQTRERALRLPCVGYLRKTEPAETVLAAIRRAVHLEDSTAPS